MNKIAKLKLVVASLLIGATMYLAGNWHASASTSGVAVDSSASPRSLYVNNCARCHGGDGRAQTRLGKKLEADDITGGVSTSKTVRIVTNGKGDMPSFRKRLTKAQIAQIAGYVRSL